jgi:hypothetical protein
MEGECGLVQFCLEHIWKTLANSQIGVGNAQTLVFLVVLHEN